MRQRQLAWVAGLGHWSGVALVALVLGVAVGGCRTVAITSEPSGATVRINGHEAGVTPLECRVWQRLALFPGDYVIEAELAGYAPVRRRFREGPADNVFTVIPEAVKFELQALPAGRSKAE